MCGWTGSHIFELGHFDRENFEVGQFIHLYPEAFQQPDWDGMRLHIGEDSKELSMEVDEADAGDGESFISLRAQPYLRPLLGSPLLNEGWKPSATNMEMVPDPVSLNKIGVTTHRLQELV